MDNILQLKQIAVALNGCVMDKSESVILYKAGRP